MTLIRSAVLAASAALPLLAVAQGETPAPATPAAAPAATPAPAPPPPPPPAQAERKSRDLGDIYTQCGLGGLIARRTAWLAVTTNIVWDLGLTATSSELSTPESCKGVDAQAAALILETYPAMERELAQGGGEHIDALLAVTSCDPAVRDELTAAVRRGFAPVVAEAGYAQQPRVDQARSFYHVFSTEVQQNFAQSCTLG